MSAVPASPSACRLSGDLRSASHFQQFEAAKPPCMHFASPSATPAALTRRVPPRIKWSVLLDLTASAGPRCLFLRQHPEKADYGTPKRLIGSQHAWHNILVESVSRPLIGGTHTPRKRCK